MHSNFKFCGPCESQYELLYLDVDEHGGGFVLKSHIHHT